MILKASAVYQIADYDFGAKNLDGAFKKEIAKVITDEFLKPRSLRRMVEMTKRKVDQATRESVELFAPTPEDKYIFGLGRGGNLRKDVNSVWKALLTGSKEKNMEVAYRVAKGGGRPRVTITARWNTSKFYNQRLGSFETEKGDTIDWLRWMFEGSPTIAGFVYYGPPQSNLDENRLKRSRTGLAIMSSSKTRSFKEPSRRPNNWQYYKDVIEQRMVLSDEEFVSVLE